LVVARIVRVRVLEHGHVTRQWQVGVREVDSDAALTPQVGVRRVLRTTQSFLLNKHNQLDKHIMNK
jgi:hypothetical protein